MNREYKTLNNYMLKTAKKLKVINEMGGCCSKCGESRHWMLEFHHTDPSIKDENISIKMFTRRDSKLLDEVNKCILVCANCHRELHNLQKCESRSSPKKRMFLDYKNQNSCQKCGYNKCIESLEFHHRDTSSKEFALSKVINRSINMNDKEQQLQEELDKCDVLCANCHREVHYDVDKFLKYNDQILSKIDTHKEKIEPLPKEEIKEKYLNGARVIDLAKEYGVNKSTICTITRKLNLGKSLNDRIQEKEIKKNKVLELYNNGKSISEISKELQIKIVTIKNYIYTKK